MTLLTRDASGATKTVKTLDDILMFVDPAGESVTEVTSLRNYFSDDFGGNTLDLTRWDVFDGGLGALNGAAGQTVNGAAQAPIGTGTTGITHGVAGSALSVAMGTTSGAEKWLLSKTMFCGSEDILLVAMVSQKLVANSIQIGFVEVDPVTGYPMLNPNIAGDFTNRVTLELSQTTGTTTASLRTVADSSPAETAVSGVLTSAAMTTAFEAMIQIRAEDIHCQSGTIDSAVAKNSNTLRISSQVPNDTKVYKLIVRLKNVAAPATSTTFTLYRVLVQDHQAVSVSVAEGAGGQTGSQGMAVNIAPGSNQIGSVVAQQGYNDTTTPLAAGTQFTGTGRSAAALYMFTRFGAVSTADVAGTLFVEASLDSGATWYVVGAAAAVQLAAGSYVADVEVKLRSAISTSANQFRTRYVNGATAQTLFRVASNFAAA